MTLALGLIVPLLAFAEISDESLLGPGLRSRPAYDGSASRRAELVPVVRYLGQPWFARSTQGVLEAGARMELVPGLHADPQLAYEPGRKTSESDFLQNHSVADVYPGASVGAQVEWDHQFGPMPITLLARAPGQYTDSNRGAQLDLRVSAGAFRSERIAAGVSSRATRANAKSAGSLYDVTPQQSAATACRHSVQEADGCLQASDCSGRLT